MIINGQKHSNQGIAVELFEIGVLKVFLKVNVLLKICTYIILKKYNF